MCGIVGYIGKNKALSVILEGLKRLEYRGYDSAGLAIIFEREIYSFRTPGKISSLERRLKKDSSSSFFRGKIGIGHTRWATHGKPSQENAHPHFDCKGKIALVHNGIIENHSFLREKMKRRGHIFSSQTDTEVLAHLIEEYFEGELEEAVVKALREVEGSYALAIVTKDEEKVLGIRKGNPLLVGMGEGEYFLASDVPALLPYTREVITLEDGEMAILSPEGVEIKTSEGKRIEKKVLYIPWNLEQAEKGGFAHFMLKEIFEQPYALEETIKGRVKPRGGIYFEELEYTHWLKGMERVIIVGCGTSYYAGLVGEYLLEELARIPVEVEYASEFRYRDPILNEKTLVLGISQSGETADTLVAVKEARKRRAKVISICNRVGSSLSRECDFTLFTRAGIEIGVASTKSFTSQLALLLLFSLLLGKERGVLGEEKIEEVVEELALIPEKIELLLGEEKHILSLAQKYYQAKHFLYLGRGKGFPIALEGALKLKEVSYIHAEGLPAAEMKHGPIALIDENMPVVALAFRGRRYDKILSNIEEVRTRGGRILALASLGDEKIKELAEDVIYIPPTLHFLTPILAVIPLQLLAYHIAVLRGCEVDQPRNLAKSVTVE